MKKKNIISLLLIFVFISDSLGKELFIYENAELFENQLFHYLYSSIDKNFIDSVKFSNLTSRKSSTLNLSESIALYLFSMENRKYKKYVIWALERMYSLSSDPKLNELLLWNLAFQQEKKEDFLLSSELYSLFKKMFPGSKFYWQARYKEILMSFNYCHEYYHDTVDLEKTMNLCEEYMIDIDEMNSDFMNHVVFIYQDLSLRILKKNINIISFYKTKYNYSRELSVFVSCLQRFQLIFEKINHFQKYIYKDIEVKKNKVYIFSLSEIVTLINDFFKVYEIEELPSGSNFINDYDFLMKKIKKRKSFFYRDIESLYKKISYFIDAYYEL